MKKKNEITLNCYRIINKETKSVRPNVCASNVNLIHHVNTTVIGGRQLQKQRYLLNEIR